MQQRWRGQGHSGIKQKPPYTQYPSGLWRDGGGHQLEVCFSSGMWWLLVAVRLRHSWIRWRNERKVTIRKSSLYLQVGVFSSLTLILGTSWLPGEGEEGEEVLQNLTDV